MESGSRAGIDTDITFRFVTRTFSEDYQVYGKAKEKQETEMLSDIDEFAPLRKKCRIVPEFGPCAALFEEGGNVFLVASALSRGKEDSAGRAMRFSFCQIFDDWPKASAAFAKLVKRWGEAEEEMQSLIKEIPGTATELGRVDFDEEAFMKWLETSEKRDFAPEEMKDGDSCPLEKADVPCRRPSKKCLLKWQRREGDRVRCERIEQTENEKNLAKKDWEISKLVKFLDKFGNRCFTVLSALVALALLGAFFPWKDFTTPTGTREGGGTVAGSTVKVPPCSLKERKFHRCGAGGSAHRFELGRCRHTGRERHFRRRFPRDGSPRAFGKWAFYR